MCLLLPHVAATKKDRVQTLVLDLETKCTPELDARSCQCFLTVVSSAFKYVDCSDKPHATTHDNHMKHTTKCCHVNALFVINMHTYYKCSKCYWNRWYYNVTLLLLLKMRLSVCGPGFNEN